MDETRLRFLSRCHGPLVQVEIPKLKQLRILHGKQSGIRGQRAHSKRKRLEAKGEMASSARRMRNEEDISDLLKAMRGELTPRDMACLGYSRNTKRIIKQMIEASPAMEEAIIALADSAYTDGLDAGD